MNSDSVAAEGEAALSPEANQPLAEDWLELTVAAPLEATEAVAEVLRRHAPAGVAIEEPFRPLADDHAFVLDPSRPACVRAYVLLESPAARTPLRRRLRSELARLPWPTSLRTRRLGPSTLDEWAQSWKAHFGVEKVGRRLLICPSWIEYAPSQDEIVLRLDPDMAFGTGQHPTTRLCLQALEDYVRPGARVLDIGTGSGILAVAAALLRASSVTALDTDPIAVETTRVNARANGVDGRVRVYRGSLGRNWPFPEPPAPLDIVVTNISTTFVLENAAALLELLSPADPGVLIVSGVPQEHRPAAEAALATAGGRVIDDRAEDGWCALVASQSP